MLKENRILPELVFTAEEAAEILKVSSKTVYRLVDRNYPIFAKSACIRDRMANLISPKSSSAG